MDLAEFVETSLRNLIDGVLAAQEYAATMGAAVNPQFNPQGNPGGILGTTGSDAPVHQITFDVAVTAREHTEGGGAMKVQVVGVFGAKGGLTSTQGSESVSHVKFMVPLAFPVDQTSKEEMEEKSRKRKERLRSVTPPPPAGWMG